MLGSSPKADAMSKCRRRELAKFRRVLNVYPPITRVTLQRRAQAELHWNKLRLSEFMAVRDCRK